MSLLRGARKAAAPVLLAISFLFSAPSWTGGEAGIGIGVVSGAESNSVSLDEVKKVCNDKKVKIGSIAEMSQVIKAANIVEGLCRKRFMASLNELDGILKRPRESLCDDESFEAIKSYHFRFISPMRHLNRRPNQFDPDPREVVRAQLHPEPRKNSLQFDEYDQILMIPIAVRHFWLSFALQLSAQCKRNLLDNLRSDVAKYLGEDDHAVMDVFNRESPVGAIMAEGMSMINFDNVLYMPELEGEIRGENRPGHEQVFVKTEASKNSSLFVLVSSCQTRFKPIYQKLLMPVIRLAKLGYDYQGDQFTVRERQELVGPEVKSWLGLVNVCETFERVIVLNSHKNDESQGDVKKRQETSGIGAGTGQEQQENKLETITSEEAERLTGGLVKSGEPPATTNGSRGSARGDDDADLSLIESDKTIEYEVSKLNRMADELWITSERQLDLELSKKPGNTNPFGFKGFMRRLGSRIRRALAKLDPDKFAHYRHNSLWYAGVFNLISSLTNALSTATTATFVILAFV